MPAKKTTPKTAKKTPAAEKTPAFEKKVQKKIEEAEVTGQHTVKCYCNPDTQRALYQADGLAHHGSW